MISDQIPHSAAVDETWLTAYLFFEGNPYLGTADRVIQEVITPLVTATRRDDLFTGWFFLRYWEEGSHIRLRFRTANSDRLRKRVEGSLSEFGHRVHRLRWETYEPEFERYGGEAGVQFAEAVFEASSEAALGSLASVEPGTRPGKLSLGLEALLALLQAMLGDPLSAARLCEEYGRNYLGSLVRDAEEQRHWIDTYQAKFRSQEERLRKQVWHAWHQQEQDQCRTPEIGRYHRRLGELRHELLRLLGEERLVVQGQPLKSPERALRYLLPSYAHMMNNRLGISIKEESYLATLVHASLTPPDGGTPCN